MIPRASRLSRLAPETEQLTTMITLWTYDWVPDFAAPLMKAFRVRWALEEAGLPYEVRTIQVGEQQTSPEHLTRQPFGQAPAFDEDGLSLFESGAIVLRIAERSQTLLPNDPPGRARATAWMFAAVSSLEPAIQELGGIDFFHSGEAWAQARRPAVEALIRERLHRLEAALDSQDYLEERFSAGDLMTVDVLRILDHTDLLDPRPALKAYKNRCETRPAFQRALAAQLAGFRADVDTR